MASFDYTRDSVVHTNLTKMLARRGYDVHPGWYPTYVETEQPVWCAVVASQTRTPCAVFMAHTASANVAIARVVVKCMEAHGCDDAVLVCESVTSSAQSLFADIMKSNQYVVRLKPGELAFDLMSHKEVPDQVLLTRDQADTELVAYGVGRHEIAKMFLTDPVSRRLGAHLGDVIRVTRMRVTTGTSISFRYVIGDEDK